MPTTVIRNADWVIAWDAAAGRHVYRRGVDVAFTDDRIAFIGPNFAGPADRTIDGARRGVSQRINDYVEHRQVRDLCGQRIRRRHEDGHDHVFHRCRQSVVCERAAVSQHELTAAG